MSARLRCSACDAAAAISASYGYPVHQWRFASTLDKDDVPVAHSLLFCNDCYFAKPHPLSERLCCIWCAAAVTSYHGPFLCIDRLEIGPAHSTRTRWLQHDTRIIECGQCAGKAAKLWCRGCARWSTEKHPVSVGALGRCPDCVLTDRRRDHVRRLVRGRCEGILSDDDDEYGGEDDVDRECDDEGFLAHDNDVQCLGAARLCGKCRALATD